MLLRLRSHVVSRHPITVAMWRRHAWLSFATALAVTIALTHSTCVSAQNASTPGDASYLVLKDEVDAIDATSGSMEQGAPRVAEWVDGHVDALSDLDPSQLWWLLIHLQHADVALNHSQFNVTWRGRMSVPVTGEYTLWISPARLSFDAIREKVTYRTTIAMDGQTICDTEAAPFSATGYQVQLQAGSPAEIVFSYQVHQEGIPVWHTGVQETVAPHFAQLMWSGPGIARQVVPERAFSTSNGEAGLRVDYSSERDGVVTNRTHIEPNIDRAWLFHQCVYRKYDAQLRLVAGALHRQLVSPVYLDRCENDNHPHPFLYDTKLVEFMSTPERLAFLEEILARPGIVDNLPFDVAVAVYRAFRTAAPEAAMDVVIRSAVRHRIPRASIADDCFSANRDIYRDLAWMCGWEMPEHLTILRERVKAADGTCVLPLGFALTYAYHEQGRIGEWIATIEQALQITPAQGDARASWELLRAQCAEIEDTKGGRGVLNRHAFYRGEPWSEKAMQHAATDDMILAAVTDSVSRLVSHGATAAAHEMTNRAMDRLASPSARSELAGIHAKIDEVANQRLQAAAAHSLAQVESRRAFLIDQRDKARAIGDTEQVEYFDGQLDSFSN